jgi:hypothetical protein
MTTRTWVRLGLVALAVPQLFTGLWAIFDSAGWYDDFPGTGASWVAADGPYNGHLATDAGAGFLATAVILLLAAAWGRRREVTLALVGYLAFAVPHLSYHLRNSAPGLTDSENAQSVSGLVVGAILPLVLLWGNRTGVDDAPAASDPAGEPASARS